MATIRDVAKKSGLSVATVSAVINGKSGVSPASTERVRAAVKELDYRPNRFAQALSNSRSSMVAVLIPAIDNPFFPQVIKSVEDVFHDNGYSTFICNTEGNLNKTHSYLEHILAGFTAGLIISLTWELTHPSTMKMIRASNVPVVGLAGARLVDGFDAVVSNDFHGAKEATNYLMQLGHKRIGFVATRKSQTSVVRLNGYKKALEEGGLPYDESLIALGSNYDNSEGYLLAKSLLNRANPPTALFCFNDVMAIGALAAAQEEQLAVPQQLSIFGFDDSCGEYSYPPLSSVALRKKEMGFLAASLLMEKIKGQEKEPQVIKLRPQLVIRNSTAPPQRLAP